VLRDLLREHLERIYLYSYNESHNRAAAIDRTRYTLLRVARTVHSIPTGCPFLTWVFLALEEDRVYPEESPDFWRLLVIAEEERQADADLAAGEAHRKVGDGSVAAPPGAGSTDARTAGESARAPGARASTASHPTLRPLVSLYRRFLDTPGAGGAEPRANWPGAAVDLDCFLRAQFAETGDCSDSTAPAWRRWLVKRPWRRPRNIIAAAIIVVAVAVGLVLALTLSPPQGKWSGFFSSTRIETADAPGAEHLVQSGAGPVASVQPARRLIVPGKASMQITDAVCATSTRELLRFSWGPVQGVTEYRLCLLTTGRDTLGVVPAITGTTVNVRVGGVPGLRGPGSFLFRVDGLAGGRLLATSNPQPFSVP
jgi:hypothetical protein